MGTALVSSVFAKFLSKEVRAVQQVSTHEHAALAAEFLDTLSAEQRRQTVFLFTSSERRNWHYVPRRRKGLPWTAMNAQQRAAADALLDFALSKVGYRKAKDIMRLEKVLHQQEGFFARSRDPENYAFSLFGEPPNVPWGWRVEGHHLSLNFSVLGDEYIAVTPAFLGSNPAEVHEGPLQGLRVQAQEQDLARELVRSLEPAQRQRVVLGERSLGDIVTGPGRAESLQTPAGLPLGDMNETRRDLAMRLIAAYVGNLRDDLSRAQWRQIREAGSERIHFAWAGALEPGKAHYYRLHGPRLLIEYDNTQNNANHIHTVWRDPKGDFGDALGEHYTAAGEHHHHGHSAES
jgi:hypothetical protein